MTEARETVLDRLERETGCRRQPLEAAYDAGYLRGHADGYYQGQTDTREDLADIIGKSGR